MIAPVMVVDDEAMVRKSLAQAVESSGAEVVTAADGQEALELFREMRNPLVFVDVRMPGMGGVALVRSLKSLAPETAVVLITGFATEELAAEAVRAGASRVLSKPVTFDEIQRVLSESLGPIAGEGWRKAPVLTESPRMEAALALARRVAGTDATVLIQGETGTGKELMARFIHEASPRANGPFVAVNCCALPETLVESELFGHERGAFTGAAARRTGWFEVAAGGTLVLDEVSEIPLTVQAKLLRTLQERVVHRVGSSQAVKVNVRVLAISNRDLRTEVKAGRFREDLFYRLNVVNISLPALRERAGDLPLLCRHFLRKYAEATGSPAETLSPEAMERLLAHSWPGNIRELENAIQRAVILASGREIEAEHVLAEASFAPAPPLEAAGRTVMEHEKELILSTLKRLNGNRTHTAKALGISVRTIRNRLREYRVLSGGTTC
ncbi:MAG TPA: sigma-54 dependent transcriptional regulator [Candidatus Bathyarchaeia archaeon]|nr:sigma-54 dependent transcriptional regulator [Candidatus Bathyarchaeia archaeon]